jgi:hypothetical protein
MMFIKMGGIKRSTLGLCLSVFVNEQFPIKPISMMNPFPLGGVVAVN